MTFREGGNWPKNILCWVVCVVVVHSLFLEHVNPALGGGGGGGGGGKERDLRTRITIILENKVELSEERNAKSKWGKVCLESSFFFSGFRFLHLAFLTSDRNLAHIPSPPPAYFFFLLNPTSSSSPAARDCVSPQIEMKRQASPPQVVETEGVFDLTGD